MEKNKKDDLDAVRELVATLEPFSGEEQKRIIRWACEKLGIDVFEGPFVKRGEERPEPVAAKETGVSSSRPAKDIKTFVESKNPKIDNHFAAVVAYYYQFEAPEEERKNTISMKDLREATRYADWKRLKRPDQILVNATKVGLLDNVSRGHYRINSVGENLVAMVLPDTSNGVQTPPKRKSIRHKSSKKKKK